MWYNLQFFRDVRMFPKTLFKNFNYIHFPAERKATMLEIPPKAVVMAENEEMLEKFTTVYSGVLDIIPIVTGKTKSGGEFYSAVNHELSGSFPEIQVKCECRYPLNEDLCTLCGECVIACPLDAIDEEIIIDFTKCDYCGKCVDTCPENAIDLYRYENHIFDAPQVLFLDDNKKINEYSEINGVYHLDEKEELFANIGTFQIEQSVSHNKEICQYSGRLDLGCQRCMEACEYKAVRKSSNGIEVDHFACEDCGQCISVCPTGAMQSEDVSDEAFGDLIYEKLQEQGGDYRHVIFVQESDTVFFYKNYYDKIAEDVLLVILPNVYILNIFHFLLLLRLGIANIHVFQEIFKESGLYKHIQFTNALSSYAFSGRKIVSKGQAPEFSEEKDKLFTSDFTFPGYKNKRKFLAPILRDIYEKSENKRVLLQENILNTFGSVVCDEKKCSLCLACLNHCKIGSLMADSSNYTLSHIAANCIQCGICLNVCPENALELVAGLLLDEEFFQPRILAKDEPVACAECGKVFGNRKSLEQVRNKLKSAGRFEDEMELLDYCDKCRVKKQLEVG
ncbi:4Fe-4S binding protein [Flexistipes sinusarabici]|nr:4Fe-4S binding protein [Flexistipes sinusarabici]